MKLIDTIRKVLTAPDDVARLRAEFTALQQAHVALRGEHSELQGKHARLESNHAALEAVNTRLQKKVMALGQAHTTHSESCVFRYQTIVSAILKMNVALPLSRLLRPQDGAAPPQPVPENATENQKLAASIPANVNLF